jgi:hypothetical protein
MCAVALLCASLHAQVADNVLVDNAYPSALDGGDGFRFSRFITADLNRDHHPLIVAVYTNGAAAAVRVLDHAGQVLSAPELRGMKGFHGSLTAVDLNADGVPEIVVRLTAGHGLDNPEAWIFRWSGGVLRPISPTCATGTLVFTCLGEVTFVDLKGDGSLSILSWPSFQISADSGSPEPAGPWTLYTADGDTFVEQPNAYVYAAEFTRAKAQPFTASEDFSAPPGNGMIRVINGSGNAAADTGHVYLNGVEVISPSDFKRNQPSFAVRATLKKSNTIAVRLDGKANTKIELLVEPAP